MAEIVGGFGVPHNPHFPGWVADGAPAAGEIARMYGGVAEHLRRVRPDVLLFFTGDHYNIFFEACVPIFGIGVAESANGASDYPELRRRPVPIAGRPRPPRPRRDGARRLRRRHESGVRLRPHGHRAAWR